MVGNQINIWFNLFIVSLSQLNHKNRTSQKKIKQIQGRWCPFPMDLYVVFNFYKDGFVRVGLDFFFTVVRVGLLYNIYIYAICPF